MECKRKKLRRRSDQLILSIVHDIKKIAPLLKQITDILDTVMEKEMEILEENRKSK